MMNYHIEIGLDLKDDPCISKIERVATILLSKVEAISQIYKISIFKISLTFRDLYLIFFMLGEINLYSWLHIQIFMWFPGTLCPTP